MSGKTELLPCPFCGGEANVIDHHNDDGSVSVGCNNDTCLGFSGLGWLYKTEAEAIAAWNRRAERTCKPHGEWERVSQTQEIRHIYCDCGEYLGMDRRNSLPFVNECKADMPNYCQKCGAKVIERKD